MLRETPEVKPVPGQVGAHHVTSKAGLLSSFFFSRRAAHRQDGQTGLPLDAARGGDRLLTHQDMEKKNSVNHCYNFPTRSLPLVAEKTNKQKMVAELLL